MVAAILEKPEVQGSEQATKEQLKAALEQLTEEEQLAFKCYILTVARISEGQPVPGIESKNENFRC